MHRPNLILRGSAAAAMVLMVAPALDAAGCVEAAAFVAIASFESNESLVPLAALMPEQSTQTKLLLVLEATNDLAQSSAAITSAQQLIANLPPAPQDCPVPPVIASASAKLQSAKSTISQVAAGLTALTGPIPPKTFFALQAESIADVEAVIVLLDAARLQLLGQGPTCAADLDANGAVDGADLGILLGSFGSLGRAEADLDGSGTVDGADLGLLLAAWGAC